MKEEGRVENDLIELKLLCEPPWFVRFPSVHTHTYIQTFAAQGKRSMVKLRDELRDE